MLGTVKRDWPQNNKAITELHITFLGGCTRTWVKCEAIGDSCHLKHSLNSQHHNHKRLDTSTQYQRPQLVEAGPVHKHVVFAVAFDEAPSLAQLPVPKIEQRKVRFVSFIRIYQDVARQLI